MLASSAKNIADENFQNKRNDLLIDIFTVIEANAKEGSYYCYYTFNDDCTYYDFEHVKLQLKFLGYAVEELDNDVTRRRTHNSFMIISSASYKVLISWG